MNALITLNFLNSRAYSSLFIYRNGSIICYLFVYVDDLVIIGNDSTFVHTIIQQLSSNFLMKDMGTLHYFLGVEVISTRACLFLSQHQYICNLLSKTNMVSTKDGSTPLSS